MPQYINIALPIPTRRYFTYSLADELSVECGMRVLVPFGKRTMTGIVVETGVAALKDAKPILEILDQEAVVQRSVLELTKWIAEYYLASWGETLFAALPQGMSPESVVRVSLLRPLDDQDIVFMHRHAPKRAALLRILSEHKGHVSVGYLQKQLKTDSVAAQLESLEQAGIIAIERSISESAKPRIQKALALQPELLDDERRMHTVLDDLDKRAPKQAQLLSCVYLHAVQHNRPMIQAEAIKKAHTASATVKALEQAGYIRVVEIEVARHKENPDEAELLHDVDETTYALNDEQAHATSSICKALDTSKHKTFLLHGVTGSGKTLVYMRAIQHVLSVGKSALILVPEISLTPQLIDRFRSVFGDAIAVLHSRMAIGERYDQWRSIRRGEVQVVLGVRSALFAPLNNCGLVVVDEEHEASYKQESPSPRYNARDCAVMRGIIDNAVVVLGSATPSLESMFNAQTGKYHLLEIKNRVDNAVLPEVQVVDIVAERKRKAMLGSFSKELVDAIELRLQKKEGVILLHNRRGYAPRLECVDCGYIPCCDDCSVALTYHKHQNLLRCHYCGKTSALMRVCPQCGSVDLNDIGAGTQRIEEDLAEILTKRGLTPVVRRVDLDSTARKGSFRTMLSDFKKGKIDILVGTKMLAKGLDFERVTLVGVVNADLQLYIPDFRSSERSFQLLTQVSGRAGRSADKRGQVILQTAHPKHPAVIATKLSDYHLMYNDELQQRRDANFPPFTRFVLIEISGRNLQQVEDHVQHFAFALPRKHPAMQILGPTRPSIDRLRGSYRRIIIIKGSKTEDPSGAILRQALHHAAAQYRERHASSAVKLSIDVDSYTAV